LGLLFKLKLKGGLRAQARRLKQPKHWVFLIVGLLAACTWIGSLVLNSLLQGSAQPPPPEVALLAAKGGVFVVVALTVLGAFNHRGLYLPKEEIELAFSVPISRGDLIRYRLFVNLMKSLIAALLFGVAASLRLRGHVFAFVGVFVTMLTIPVLGQCLALYLGDAENRLGRVAKKLPLRFFTIALAMTLAIGVAALFLGGSASTHVFGELERGGSGLMMHIEQVPAVRAVLWPFTPWARMITAETLAQFLPWFLFAAGFWLLVFEWTVRVPIDFRELSLATSADVAKRINRLRRGTFHAGQSQVTRATIGWNVPWILGRGAFGAVAWHKTAAIVRKARGTVTLSVLIILLLTMLTLVFTQGEQDPFAAARTSALIIAVAGTLYLCAVLRFDFRSDLEIMDRIKTWPLRPSMLFLATLLPEVMLVSGLLVLAVIGRTAWLGGFQPAIVGVVAFQPLVVLTWVALDNAVYLFSPVRYTPGEEGALQNMGRSMLLMILRMLLGLVVVAVAILPAVAVYFLVRHGLMPRAYPVGVEIDADYEDKIAAASTTAAWIAGTVAWLGVVGVDAALVWLGGFMLERFDVARDKGA
jgi:hypothetical protein